MITVTFARSTREHPNRKGEGRFNLQFNTIEEAANFYANSYRSLCTVDTSLSTRDTIKFATKVYSLVRKRHRSKRIKGGTN